MDNRLRDDDQYQQIYPLYWRQGVTVFRGQHFRAILPNQVNLDVYHSHAEPKSFNAIFKKEQN